MLTQTILAFVAAFGAAQAATYKASFTEYGSGDQNGSPNCNTNTVACGFFSAVRSPHGIFSPFFSHTDKHNRTNTKLLCPKTFSASAPVLELVPLAVHATSSLPRLTPRATNLATRAIASSSRSTIYALPTATPCAPRTVSQVPTNTARTSTSTSARMTVLQLPSLVILVLVSRSGLLRRLAAKEVDCGST